MPTLLYTPTTHRTPSRHTHTPSHTMADTAVEMDVPTQAIQHDEDAQQQQQQDDDSSSHHGQHTNNNMEEEEQDQEEQEEESSGGKAVEFEPPLVGLIYVFYIMRTHPPSWSSYTSPSTSWSLHSFSQSLTHTQLHTHTTVKRHQSHPPRRG